MFGFWRKKVDTEKVKSFKDAIKAIDVYIYLENWDKAILAISEVKDKEKQSFEDLKAKYSNDIKKIEEITKTYNKNIQIIDKLKKKLELKKLNYEKKREEELFKLKFKKIKDELNDLLWKGKNTEALSLLTNFLEENKKVSSVVTFYAKEKDRILKNIENTKKQKREKIKQNDEIEALRLIWETIKTKEKKPKNKKQKQEKWFIEKIRDKLNFYKKIKEKLKRKKLLDEVKMLIEEENNIKQDIAKKKLENIHKGLTKQLHKQNLIWYEIFWKILWHDKISWDTFDFTETAKEYNFFLWDATGHWVRAWLIVSILNRNFKQYSQSNNFKELIFKTNNNLQEELENRNFVTWIFFRIEKNNIDNITYTGMWHEPMIFYKEKEKKVEKIIAWWLALWIRAIKSIDDVKVNNLKLNNNDIILVYSDWVTDIKNEKWQFYWIERLQKVFLEACKADKNNITKIYDYIIEDLELFKKWTNFDDDTTILIIKRDTSKDIVKEWTDKLQEIIIKEWLSKKESKKLIWKNEKEIKEELEKIKKQKQIKHIVNILENLYLTWEILKLKEEATRFIKEWYIDSKINYYLKKAIANETKYKIKQKNQKLENRYNTLLELYKSGDYSTVIKECQDIIIKNWEY